MLASPFSGKLQSAYDSHVHWRGTGSVRRWHNLKSIASTVELSKISKLVSAQNNWVLATGWDQHRISDPHNIHRKTLDQFFSSGPVYFRRVDAHAAWVNTMALKKADLFHQHIKSPFGGKIELDAEGWPTGVLIDSAMEPVRRLLPLDDPHTIQEDLLVGQEIFHIAGFTHIRDMTCDELQWQAACELAQKGKLQLAVEVFFGSQNVEGFDKMLALAKAAKQQVVTQLQESQSMRPNSSLNLLRPQGVKVFLDGALGSEGAWISHDYSSGSGRGLQIIEIQKLKDMITQCFSADLVIAIHAIGDEAIHQIAVAALELKELGIEGEIHIEHAQVIRDDTLNLLKHINVTCFMQPSHWLSDRHWLQDKIGDLEKKCFRWAELEKLKIPFFFGSDCPIEATSLEQTLSALQVSSQNGFPPLTGRWEERVQHPDLNWCPDTYTVFENAKPVSVVFRGQKIIPKN